MDEDEKYICKSCGAEGVYVLFSDCSNLLIIKRNRIGKVSELRLKDKGYEGEYERILLSDDELIDAYGNLGKFIKDFNIKGD